MGRSKLLVLALQWCVVSAEYPPCLDSSARVPQVNGLVSDSLVSQGFSNWNQAVALAKHLYSNAVKGVQTVWLGVCYKIDDSFISFEDCSLVENRGLSRCANQNYRYRVQFRAPGILPGNGAVHAWIFDDGASPPTVVGNESGWIYERPPPLYYCSNSAWYGVNGWTNLYSMQNGKQGRSYCKTPGAFTISSIYGVDTEKLCPDGIGDVTPGAPVAAIVGAVIGVMVCLIIICMVMFLMKKRKLRTEFNSYPSEKHQVELGTSPVYAGSGQGVPVAQPVRRRDSDSCSRSSSEEFTPIKPKPVEQQPQQPQHHFAPAPIQYVQPPIQQPRGDPIHVDPTRQEPVYMPRSIDTSKPMNQNFPQQPVSEPVPAPGSEYQQPYVPAYETYVAPPAYDASRDANAPPSYY